MATQPKRRRTDNNSGVRRFLKQQIVVFLLYGILLLIATFLFFSLGVKRRELAVFSLAVCAAAAVLSGIYAGKKAKKRGWLAGLTLTLAPHLLLLLLSVFLNGFAVDWTALFSMVILSLCAMLGGMIGVNLRPTIHKQRRKGSRV